MVLALELWGRRLELDRLDHLLVRHDLREVAVVGVGPTSGLPHAVRTVVRQGDAEPPSFTSLVLVHVRVMPAGTRHRAIASASISVLKTTARRALTCPRTCVEYVSRTYSPQDAAGDVGGQALELGLGDEVAMDVVPVVFGSGKRYFGPVGDKHLLEDPDVVIRGNRVLHLRYRVRR